MKIQWVRGEGRGSYAFRNYAFPNGAVDGNVIRAMKLCIHVRPRDDGQGWAVDVFDGRRAWSKTHLGEQPLNKAEAHRLAHQLRDPKFYTARTKRAVNSLTVERGPKVVPHE